MSTPGTQADESWKPLSDYAKTIVATAAGFLAFTGTFAKDIISEGANVFLIGAWALLLVTITAAFVVIAAIVEQVKPGADTAATRRRSILAANVSYFAFGMAAILFFVALLRAPGANREEAGAQELVTGAARLVMALDSAWHPAPPIDVHRVDGSTAWEFVYALGTDSVMMVSLTADGASLLRFRRQALP